MPEEQFVSAIIATYNYGRYLAGAIDSVLGQTFGNFEIIVVDDGSNDSTSEVIGPYLDDPRIRYVRTDHLGQPAAKNQGIRLARGNLIAFLDADDLWLPAKLEKQAELFARDDGGLGVVYCPMTWIDEHGRELGRPTRTPLRGNVLGPLFHNPFVCFSSSVIRRAVLDDVGLFDESLPMSIDYDLWLRIAMKYRFDYVDEPLVKYRTGHANLSSRLPERNPCVRRIIYRFLDEYGGRDRLDRALVRLVLADHFCDTAILMGGGLRPPAFPWYLRSLGRRPLHGRVWKELATGWWPEPVKTAARKLLGRPDWRGT